MQKKTNNIVVVVPFYQRERVTSICFNRLKEQSKKFGFDVITCGSEGEKSRKFAESFEFKYIEKENIPVSMKFQALIDEVKRMNYAGVVVIGSDNLISDKLFEIYSTININKKVVYGVDDVVFYRTSDKSVKTKGTYNQNKMTLGVGRLYSRALLKEIKYSLFDKEVNSGIDTLAWNKVKDFSQVVELENAILDVKHELNITDHSIVDGCKVNLGIEYLAMNFLNEFEELKALSNEVVAVRNVSNPRLTRNKLLPLNKRAFTIEFIVDVLNFKVGDVKSGLSYATAIQLVRSKKAKLKDGHTS